MPHINIRSALILFLLCTTYAAPASSTEIFREEQFLHMGSPGLVTSLSGAWYGEALAAGDFNGDGFVDLAVGAPKHAIAGQENAGAVHILYADEDGLTSVNDELWSRNSSGVPGSAQEDEEFGRRLAAGDFDGDGYDDLAIGAPQKNLGGMFYAGEVVVIYGSHLGLKNTGIEAWNQDTGTIVGTAEQQDQFGDSLATGDFNGDGFDDLAVGTQRDDVGDHISAGSVNIIFGSALGLTDAGNQNRNRDLFGLPGEAATLDNFGAALASGDFDGDGYDDLAVGVPLDSEHADDAGSVDIFFGNASGVSTSGSQRWSQNSPSIFGTAEVDDRFGYSLAAGDFNGDGYFDLAIGVPFEDDEMGGCHVLYGSSGGLTATSSQYWTQDWMSGQTREADDRFGGALAAGDFDGDGDDDLVIAAPREDSSRGMAGLLLGSNSVLIPSGTNPVWMQGSSILDDSPEFDDWFGDSLTVGDIDGDGIDDLVIGAHSENIENGSTTTNAGAFHVLLSGMSRLVYPYVACNGGWQTEICVVSKDTDALNGTIKGYDANGTLLDTRKITLDALGRYAASPCTLFPESAADVRYCVFESSSGDVSGYTKFSLSGVMRGAVPAVSTYATGDFLMPHLGYNDPWWTGLGLVNLPNLRRARDIDFNTGDSARMTMTGESQTSFTIESLFDSPPEGIESAILGRAPGLLALELFGSGNMLAGVRVTDETATTLYYPHVAPGDGTWWTGLAAYNPGSSASELTITAYSESGEVLATLDRDLKPKAKLLNSVQGLGLPSTTAWVKIEGTQPLTGLELFGTADGNQLAGFTVTNFSRTSGILPKIDTAGWTGIALVNTTGVPVRVSLTAYNDSGVSTVSQAHSLEAYAKLLGTPTDLFHPFALLDASYVAFSATGPVAAFQLNGSADGMMLDALPAQ